MKRKTYSYFISIFFFLNQNFLFCQPFNLEVLEVSNQFNEGGYLLGGTGMPKDIFVGDELYLTKCDNGTFCSSYTFYVVFEMIKSNELYLFANKDSLYNFQMEWYGSTTESRETQCLFALEKRNIGKKILMKDAESGDFVQFWRNNKSGHSVIFLNWIFDSKKKIIGINYRSSQKATNGIGDKEEYFGDGERDIVLNRTYIVRLTGKSK